ncbi:MAG TPA: hypothetical protein VMQ62_09535 [Dongiaceae bacterium]|nr:hypothetical protein [Dongiaceae bacterium]
MSLAATSAPGAASAARPRGGVERRLLGELLVEAGLVTRRGLAAGLEAQRLGGGRLGVHLIRQGHLVPSVFHLFLQEHLETLRPDLVQQAKSGAEAALLPARVAHHYGLVPVGEVDGVLEVAAASFDQPGLRAAIEALTGKRIEPVIAPPSLIAAALERHYPAEVEPGVVFRPAGDHLLVLSDPRRSLGAEPLDRLAAGAPPAAWVRAILAVALRDGVRRIEIEPAGESLRISWLARSGPGTPLTLPSGPYAGIAALLEGLAGIGARGRVVPREGRFLLVAGADRRFVSVLAVPTLAGRLYRLDLRGAQVSAGPLDDATGARLDAAVGALVARGRGLLAIAATGPAEWAAGLELILEHCGAALPRRVVAGGWDDASPLDVDAAGREAFASADLVAFASPWNAGSVGMVRRLAAERVVLVAVEASDAAIAAERLGRTLAGPDGGEGPSAVVAVRHLERVCDACRVACDLTDMVARLGNALPATAAWTSSGCPACRLGGVIPMEQVAEVLELLPGRLSRPGIEARRLRAEAGGSPTITEMAIRGARDGRIEAREVVRLLLHEPR